MRSMTRKQLYAKLCALNPSTEGNLLEHNSDSERELQTEILTYWVDAGLECDCGAGILETGTNKGLFGYFLLSHVADACHLHTFCNDPISEEAVELLRQYKPRRHQYTFTLGDTRDTLPTFNEDICFAWIDGGHEYPVALSDIQHAMRLEVPVIAIDDAKMPSVAEAIQTAAVDSDYSIIYTHRWHRQERGIVVLLKTA